MDKFTKVYKNIIAEMKGKKSTKKVIKEQAEGGSTGYILTVYLMDPIELAGNCGTSFEEFKIGLEKYVTHLEKYNAEIVGHEPGMFGGDSYDIIKVQVPKGQLTDFVQGPDPSCETDDEIGSIAYNVSQGNEFPSDATDDESAKEVITGDTDGESVNTIEEGPITAGTGNVRAKYFNDEYLKKASRFLNEDDEDEDEDEDDNEEDL